MMRKRYLKGFTMIEMLMVIGLVGILSGAALSLFSTTLNDAKFDATYKELLQIRKAILGDLEATNVEGSRIRFGFMGDVGREPRYGANKLTNLASNPPGVKGWGIDNVAKQGSGWNGPYLVQSSTSDYNTDAWGNAYDWRVYGGLPHITSLGADGIYGTSDDIIIDIPRENRFGDIHGQLVSSGAVYTGTADITVYYPDDGYMQSSVSTIDATASGNFTFTHVPFGFRTVKVDVPSATNPAYTLGPVIFPVDKSDYYIPEHLLEINPADSPANCNNVSNVSYHAGSKVNLNARSRIDFQLDIKSAFSIAGMYLNNYSSSLGGPLNITGIGINGVYYGCDIATGGWHNSTTANANRQFNPNCSSVNPTTTPNIAFLSTWLIAAGNQVPAYIDFVSNSTNVQWIDLKLGCDLIRIQ